MKKTVLTIVALFAMTFIASTVHAEEKFAVGIQGSFPAWGISGKMKVNDKATAQAIIGPIGSVGSYAGRGLYTFAAKKEYEMYGYGMLGLFTSRVSTVADIGLGFGGGVGIEANWQHLAPEMPPVYFSGEVGLGFISTSNFNFPLTIGVGVHYKLKN